MIYSLNSQVASASPVDAFAAIVEGSLDFTRCPSDSRSVISAFSPCNGCPLFEVCSDECGYNDANGYLK